MRKLTCILLTFCILFSSVSIAFASSDAGSIDIYKKGYRETLILEDTEYLFEYYYNNGDRSILVTNTNDNTSQIFYSDHRTGLVYMDDQIVGRSFCAPENYPILDSRDIWIYYSYSHNTIGFAELTTMAAVVATIALCVGGIPNAAVIANISATILSTWVGATFGADTYCTIYYATGSDGNIMYKFHWCITLTTGITYGYFDTYIQQ
ncbi:MAG: hypothetical protein IJI56_02640 [Firmicutes bacterium]|nr:hypothetical protein [Bacillota bacterium]